MSTDTLEVIRKAFEEEFGGKYSFSDECSDEVERARRRAERARYWKQKFPRLAHFFNLNAPRPGIWFDDETLHHLEPSAANVTSLPIRAQFKAASMDELFELQAAAETLAKVPGYMQSIGLARPTFSFVKPPRECVAASLADHPKGRGPIYIY